MYIHIKINLRSGPRGPRSVRGLRAIRSPSVPSPNRPVPGPVPGSVSRTCPWSPFALGPLPFGEDDFLDLRIF